MARSKKISIDRLRIDLFCFWFILMLSYMLTFLLCALFKDGIDFEGASGAVWRVAYMFVPVLGAFGSFWFSGGTDLTKNGKKEFSSNTRWLLIGFSLLLHIPVVLFLSFGVLAADFPNLVASTNVGFSDRVESVMRFLFIVWSVSLLPVGWVLRKSSETLDATILSNRS